MAMAVHIDTYLHVCVHGNVMHWYKLSINMVYVAVTCGKTLVTHINIEQLAWANYNPI